MSDEHKNIVVALGAALLVSWLVVAGMTAGSNTSRAAHRCNKQDNHYWVSNAWLIGLTGECKSEKEKS